MSETPATIIVALKCPGAPRKTIIRPYLAAISDILKDLTIHLQVEDIDQGLLLFWQDQEDFDRTTNHLQSLEGLLGVSSWEKGSVLWRITLLKSTGQENAHQILDTCRAILLTLFGQQSAPEINKITLSFHIPTGFNFLDIFLENYRNYPR